MKLRIRFPKLGKVGRLGRVNLLSREKPIQPPEIGFSRGSTLQTNLVPERLRVMEDKVGHTRAGAVWRIMARGIKGTLPELCAYDWLERRPWLRFDFQASVLGGRSELGGAVADFLIWGLDAEGIYVWRIQGEYWHSGLEAEEKDYGQRLRLLQSDVDGVPIVSVVDLWENDVYEIWPRVFEMAEVGIGLRGNGK